MALQSVPDLELSASALIPVRTGIFLSPPHHIKSTKIGFYIELYFHFKNKLDKKIETLKQ